VTRVTTPPSSSYLSYDYEYPDSSSTIFTSPVDPTSGGTSAGYSGYAANEQLVGRLYSYHYKYDYTQYPYGKITPAVQDTSYPGVDTPSLSTSKISDGSSNTVLIAEKWAYCYSNNYTPTVTTTTVAGKTVTLNTYNYGGYSGYYYYGYYQPTSVTITDYNQLYGSSYNYGYIYLYSGATMPDLSTHTGVTTWYVYNYSYSYNPLVGKNMGIQTNAVPTNCSGNMVQ